MKQPPSHSLPSRRHRPSALAATQILQRAIDPETSLHDLARLASSDPGFALRIMARVNSAAFGARSKVNDVQQACMLLGVRGLRNLALSLAISDMIPERDGGRLLWAMCLRRATAARLIAEGLGQRNADEFFTAGLFLEVGLLTRASQQLEEVVGLARTPVAHRIVCERASGNDDHPTLGARLAAEFGLGDDVIAAVASHHANEPPEPILARVCWAAELVAAPWEAGEVLQNRRGAEQALSKVGMPNELVPKLLEQLPSLVAESADVMDRDAGEQADLDTLLRDAHAQLVELNSSYEDVVRRLETLLAEKHTLAAQLQEANARLRELAATDHLTGLHNKRALEEALVRDLSRAERDATPFAVVMIDLDHFKAINDTHGHPVGDEVLRHVGGVIRGALRTGDVGGRWGGEEFLIGLPNCERSGGIIVAERIRQRLGTVEAKTEAGMLKVSASFGVAHVACPGCRDAAASLLQRADKALYEAKRAGRDRVVAAS